MFSKIEDIKSCVKFLEENYSDIPLNDSANEGYSKAVEDLKSYLEYEEECIDNCYHEHFNDYSHSESKYCF